MKSPKSEEAVASSATPAAGSPSGSTDSIPRRYSMQWFIDHTDNVDAVRGKTLYFSELAAGTEVGQRYAVFKIVVTVKDPAGRPIEINPVKVGDVLITAKADADHPLIGAYTGQPIAGLDKVGYVIVSKP
jgi:hypothetical protein